MVSMIIAVRTGSLNSRVKVCLSGGMLGNRLKPIAGCVTAYYRP